jgi:formylglycine-generating enzyme required for sulfatase activity
MVTANAMRDSRWHLACAGNGKTRYGYGDNFEATFCNSNSPGPVEVSSMSDCAGNAPGLSDMNGNVEEWVDDCPPVGPGGIDGGVLADEASRRTKPCLAPAGAYNDSNNPEMFACNMVHLPEIAKRQPWIGFRRCSK